MAKYFNYTKPYEVFSKVGAALPGFQTTLAPQPITFAAVAAEELEAGQLVEVTKSNGVFKVSKCTAAAKAAGIVLADVHAQIVREGLGNQQIYAFAAGQTVTVMREGYVWVPVQDATPTITRGNAVYVRIAADSDNDAALIGGIESAAVSDETAQVSAIVWTGNVGFPETGNNNGSTETYGATGRTAEVKVQLGLL